MKSPLAVITGLAVLLGTLGGCQAQPGPPPLASDEEIQALTTPTSTATSPRKPEYLPKTYSFGIDPLQGGFNPHLISDDSQFVQLLASLVLPSAFREGRMDTDLLVSARPIAPAAGAAQTVRYEIQPEAQWSDGVPVTGNDFEYLWRAMTSTPAVLDSAGYQRISAIRTSSSGKTVDVDFSTPVADWTQLFSHILPSYLVGDPQDFSTAFSTGIPASAGRFMVSSINRSTGTVTLNRNDRFWGTHPARIDSLIFTEIRSQDQGSQLLRSRQAAQLDILPEETSALAYSLLPEVQLGSVTTSRQLSVIANAYSPLLNSVTKRRQLFSLIDVSLVAQVAGQRSSYLELGTQAMVDDTDAFTVAQRTESRPLVVAVDPMHSQAKLAAQSLVDMLSAKGLRVTLRETNLGRIAQRDLPGVEADVVVTWKPQPTSALEAVSAYECPGSLRDARSSNLSGFCDPAVQQQLRRFVAQGASKDQVAEFIEQLEQRQTLELVVMNETRIVVSSTTASNQEAIMALKAWSAGSFPRGDESSHSSTPLQGDSSPHNSQEARETPKVTGVSDK